MQKTLNQKMQTVIGRMLFIGVLVSLVAVTMGGVMYLSHYGSEVVNYQTFYAEPPHYKSIGVILTDALSFSPLSLIQFGLMTLVLVQIMRVILTGIFFYLSRDFLFVHISLFILIVLLYGLIWH